MRPIELAHQNQIDTSEVEKHEQHLRDLSNKASATTHMVRQGLVRIGIILAVGLAGLLICWGLAQIIDRYQHRFITQEQLNTVVREKDQQVDAIREKERQTATVLQQKTEQLDGVQKQLAEQNRMLEKFRNQPSQKGNGKSLTNYTIFHTNTMDNWAVVTGWRYANLESPQPETQWCYIINGTDTINYEIGHNGRMDAEIDPAKAKKAGVTPAIIQKLFPLCTWFQGSGPTQTPARDPVTVPDPVKPELKF